ncbi:WD40 repeat domain-containing protein [Solirubrobacter phytolaccae]|uniref:WD40 repeat domain-containing protein n=1 Tax=Solirubrobacter phytolaccae TaxID=1404360 RepID=A0A9X3S9B3_9ACTN|nr:WD40 repeat domain-containing protein [Solirubrobacter phytolaccae]MDA0183214.1 WD40 repeat domain-containing protein [Solirubrobacter phytolaccae]
MRFSDDGAYLITLGERIILWDVSERRRTASARFSHASSADFSPDGTLLAVKNTSGDVLVLSVPDLEEVTRLSGARLGEGTPVRFAADGTHIVDATWGGALMIRSALDGTLAWSEMGDRIFRLERSRDRAVWTYDRPMPHVRRWPFDAHKPEPIGFYGGPFSVALSDDGTRIAGISAGLEVSERQADGTWSSPEQVFPAPWDGSAHGLCWGPNDELIHAHHSTVRVFDDLHSAPRLMRLPFLARDVAISPTAKATAFGGPDQGLVLDWPLVLTSEIPDAPPNEHEDRITEIVNQARQRIEQARQRKDDPPAPN